MSQNAGDLAIRRRAVRVRAQRRGLRELDILIGGFVETQFEAFSESEIADLESLLDASDQEVLSWISGGVPLPSKFDTPIWRKMMAFHSHDRPIHR